jgi:hypothetical protein
MTLNYDAIISTVLIVMSQPHYDAQQAMLTAFMRAGEP